MSFYDETLDKQTTEPPFKYWSYFLYPRNDSNLHLSGTERTPKRNLKFNISLLSSRANSFDRIAWHSPPATWTVETVKYWGQLGETLARDTRVVSASFIINFSRRRIPDPRPNIFIAQLSNESPDIYPLFFNVSADKSAATSLLKTSLRPRNILSISNSSRNSRWIKLRWTKFSDYRDI